jgi:glyoxylase I family protein
MLPEALVTIGADAHHSSLRRVAVSDFAAARRWYEALFGWPPDMLPKEGEAVWHVTTSGSVYVTADPARAGSALVTIAVSNLDEHATALAARGLSLDEQRADSGAPRQLTITDEDGNFIKFFADPAQPTA